MEPSLKTGYQSITIIDNYNNKVSETASKHFITVLLVSYLRFSFSLWPRLGGICIEEITVVEWWRLKKNFFHKKVI